MTKLKEVFSINEAEAIGTSRFSIEFTKKEIKVLMGVIQVYQKTQGNILLGVDLFELYSQLEKSFNKTDKEREPLERIPQWRK